MVKGAKESLIASSRRFVERFCKLEMGGFRDVESVFEV